jgi:predicted transglutaminase-like protease
MEHKLVIDTSSNYVLTPSYVSLISIFLSYFLISEHHLTYLFLILKENILLLIVDTKMKQYMLNITQGDQFMNLFSCF